MAPSLLACYVDSLNRIAFLLITVTPFFIHWLYEGHFQYRARTIAEGFITAITITENHV